MFGMEIKKVNQAGLENIGKKFLALNLESLKSEKVLMDLKHLYSECNWRTFDDGFRKINQVEMKRKISFAETECEKRIFSQKKVSVLIQSLESEMNQTLIFFNTINQLPEMILKAQANVYELVEPIQTIISEIELIMSTTEISSDKVKNMYKSAKEDFERNKNDFDLLKSEEVNWIKFSSLFSENHTLIIKTRNLVRVSRDSAKYKK